MDMELPKSDQVVFYRESQTGMTSAEAKDKQKMELDPSLVSF
jgi:hypothetical protein